MTIKTKYNIGDTVWIMESNRPKSMKVTACFCGAIGDKDVKIQYSCGDKIYDECELFPSKKELMKRILLLLILCVTIIYIIVAYITLELNPCSWSEGTRFLFCIFETSVIAPGIFSIFAEEE